MILWFWLPLALIVGVRIVPLIVSGIMAFTGKREDEPDPIARY